MRHYGRGIAPEREPAVLGQGAAARVPRCPIGRGERTRQACSAPRLAPPGGAAVSLQGLQRHGLAASPGSRPPAARIPPADPGSTRNDWALEFGKTDVRQVVSPMVASTRTDPKPPRCG